MSAICQNFVQNTWKKELCSNCFKSKDEHNQNAIKTTPMAATKAKESIIKIVKTESKTKRAVSFTSQIDKVIGYGGEVWSDSEEEFQLNEDSANDSDSEPDNDEEKELKKLTKMNTDFNTINANLSVETPDLKKSYTHLKLGAPQVDAAGKRQTLLVSVTPFGQENGPKEKSPKVTSHIPIAKNKDGVFENRTSAVLTSYVNRKEEMSMKEEKSLLEEISETLEKGKSSIQIMSKKEEIIAANKPDFGADNKKNESSTQKEKDIKNNKANLTERKTAISRAPIIKRDQGKPIVYQTSTAKIELLNLRNDRAKKGAIVTDDSKKKTEKESVNAENSVVFSSLGESEKNNSYEECVNQNVGYTPNKTNSDSFTSDTITDSDGSEDSSNATNSLTESLAAEQDLALKKIESIPESREQAGEPDGHADPDNSIEPPALPTTPPPPLETRNSFLHPSEKPKLPTKPSTVLIRKPPVVTNHHESLVAPMSTFTTDLTKLKLEKTDSVGSDNGKFANKRQAPKPPQNESMYTKTIEEVAVERGAYSPTTLIMANDVSGVPEPAPRKSLSFSTDSLTTVVEEKRQKSKNRFSLKKFLRLNSHKDFTKTVENVKYEDIRPPEPQPKPRLVIVHPLDLNGAKVEVLSKPQDQVDHLYENEPRTPNKPPPPPRNFDSWNRIKPALPHPPKSTEVRNKLKHYENALYKKKEDTVYANIGEVRSAITPNKPQRTASMREREALEAHKNKTGNDYEPINTTRKENVYDYVNVARSSSPECDTSLRKTSPMYKNHKVPKGFSQRSSSTVDVSADGYKYQNIPRSASLTYCGSETESEIYSPYSFCGSETEVAEEDSEWAPNGKIHKLRSRKGRSIVHKNLEDNYGAVIVANHEALSQVLEHIQHGPTVQPALRGLKTSSNLRWTDFTIKETIQPLMVGPRIFYQALWNNHPISLVIITGSISTSPLSLGNFNLIPITEFSDLVPAKYFPNSNETDSTKQIQATVSVLPWLQINTLEMYGEILKTKMEYSSEVEAFRDASFILLQLIHALKILQAQGIEELPLPLNSFILCKEVEKDSYYRLCILQELAEEIAHPKEDVEFGSLCVCAAKALAHLNPSGPITAFLNTLLNTERAVSLSQVKAILEFSLWGPSDVSLSAHIKERELALQRWLDLQRATVLHGLVCTRVHLTVYEEHHLLFLVRTNVKMMCDASILIDSANRKHRIPTNGNLR